MNVSLVTVISTPIVFLIWACISLTARLQQPLLYFCNPVKNIFWNKLCCSAFCNFVDFINHVLSLTPVLRAAFLMSMDKNHNLTVAVSLLQLKSSAVDGKLDIYSPNNKFHCNSWWLRHEPLALCAALALCVHHLACAQHRRLAYWRFNF